MLVLYRIIALGIGYLFGLFQTGYFYAKSKGIDIHKEGSGNVGTTNTLRVLGPKAGLITFVGDLFKAIAAVVVVRLIFQNVPVLAADASGDAAGMLPLLELYVGFGAVLGHNYPCYLRFKGGKGIACTSGMILAVLPQAAPVCLVAFILAVAVTRYVSLGSILVVSLYLVQVLVFGQRGLFIGLTGSKLTEFTLISACFTALALWRHRENILRLAKGTENKLGAKKDGK